MPLVGKDSTVVRDSCCNRTQVSSCRVCRALKFNEVCTGAKEQNAEVFFVRFDLWCLKNGHSDEYKVEIFVFSIDGSAYTVYEG